MTHSVAGSGPADSLVAATSDSAVPYGPGVQMDASSVIAVAAVLAAVNEFGAETMPVVVVGTNAKRETAETTTSEWYVSMTIDSKTT